MDGVAARAVSPLGQTQTHLQVPTDQAEILRRARNALDACITDEGWRENRDRCASAFAFYDGDQWPPAARETREADGRPCLTINKVRKFVHQVVGDTRRNVSQIRVRPVDGQADPARARVREGLLRMIQQQSKFSSIQKRAVKDAVIGGWGWWRVGIEWPDDEAWDASLVICAGRNPLALYVDPGSREPDLNDARYVIVSQWMDRGQFQATFPGEPLTDFDGSLGDTRRATWYAEDAKQIRIAEYWWREPYMRELALVADDRGQTATLDLAAERDREWVQWIKDRGLVLRSRKAMATRIRYALVSGSSVLWGPRTWPGKYFPFAVVWGEEAEVDGARKLQGLVESTMDPQRMYNLWRSYMAEILALQPKVPWVGRKGAFGTGAQRDAWANSHKASLGFLEYDGDVKPQRERPPDWPTGIDREAAANSQDLKETTGIFDASLGNRSNETSGKAILARQEQAASATSTFPDNLQFAVEHTGRILNDLLPYVYDQPRAIRILGDDNEDVQIVAINGALFYGPDGEPAEHVDLLTGKYDIVSTVGPSYATARLEAFDAMKEFGKLLGPEFFQQIADKVVEFGGFPGSNELAEKIRELRTNGQGGLSPELMAQLQQIIPSPQEIEQMIDRKIAELAGSGGAPRTPPLLPGVPMGAP